MWVSSALLELFSIGKDTVNGLREDLATVRAERDTLKLQLNTQQVQSDWMRGRINSLEIERAQLIGKAYPGLHVPAMEIVTAPVVDPTFNPKDFSFEDLGDAMARKMGLPTYDN